MVEAPGFPHPATAFAFRCYDDSLAAAGSLGEYCSPPLSRILQLCSSLLTTTNLCCAFRMGDAIKRLFHRRYRSTDKDFKPPQSFPYRNALPGTPPRQGTSPLHGNFSTGAHSPLDALSPATRQRSASLGTADGASRPHRLRKAVSDASRKGRPDMSSTPKPGHGGTRSLDDARDVAPPPLPGTAVTSDDARYWRKVENGISRGFENMSLGGGDVADRDLADNFPKPPVARSSSVAQDAAIRDMLGYHDTASRPDTSYSLSNGETFPTLDPAWSNNTQSRLFLDDSSDEEKRPESSGEGGPGHSPSSLKRKKGHAGLRNFSNPRNHYSVQPTMRGDEASDGPVDGRDVRGSSRSYLVDDSSEPPSLEGVVDLRDTEYISYHSRYAPGKLGLLRPYQSSSFAYQLSRQPSPMKPYSPRYTTFVKNASFGRSIRTTCSIAYSPLSTWKFCLRATSFPLTMAHSEKFLRNMFQVAAMTIRQGIGSLQSWYPEAQEMMRNQWDLVSSRRELSMGPMVTRGGT